MDVGCVGQHAVGARAVMIGDEHVHPAVARRSHLRNRGDRAVGGDQEPRAARDQPLDGRAGEPVALGLAVRQMPVHLGAQLAQHCD